MAHVIKNYRYLYNSPLMWRLGAVLTPALKAVNDRRQAANTPVCVDNHRYAFLETRSRGAFITGLIKGDAAFIWNNQWLPLRGATA